MDNELTFRILLGLLIGSFVLHRGNYRRKHSPDQEDVLREKQADRATALTGLLSLAALLSSFVYFFKPEWMAWAAIGLPAWARWLAVPLALAGFFVIEWGQRALGSNWSDTPVLTKEQTLTLEGPYRWVRHPIYTGFLLILSAPLLIAANWFIGLAWLLMTFLDVQARAAFEEGILIEEFGQDYRSHIQRTGRFFPRLG